MALMLGDGFDFYSSGVEASTIGPWSTSNCTFPPGTTRFGVGKSLQMSGTTTQKDGFANSSSTVYAVAAYFCNSPFGSGNQTFWTWRESGTSQLTFQFDGATQSIIIRTGGTGGAVVGTFSAAFAQSSWTHFQIRAVIHPSAGEVRIRKNGDPADTFVVTGINTRGGSANSYVNGILIFGGSGSNGAFFDDMLLFDDSGVAPNTWVGDIRSYMLVPNANTATKDFTPNAVVNNFSLASGSPQARTANSVYTTIGFSPGWDGTITKVTFKATGNFTGNINACIYDNSNGLSEGNVLATGTAVNNPVTGLFDIVFPSPPAVTAAGIYHVGFYTDAAISILDGTAAGLSGWKRKDSVTYGSGFPTNPTFTATANPVFWITVTVLPANYSNVNETTYSGDTTYNYATALGNTDLYDMQDLPTTPLSIICVLARAVARKSDTSARGGQLVVKSGATTDLGTATILGTNYSGLNKAYPTDPNTGSGWTAAAVNALQVGAKVTL